MKKITKITVYYDDGTYEDITRSWAPSITVTPTPTPHNIPTPWVVPPCAKCGATANYGCTRDGCPTGWGRPWDNSNKVTD